MPVKIASIADTAPKKAGSVASASKRQRIRVHGADQITWPSWSNIIPEVGDLSWLLASRRNFDATITVKAPTR
jgi:hypothetical protein